MGRLEWLTVCVGDAKMWRLWDPIREFARGVAALDGWLSIDYGTHVMVLRGGGPWSTVSWIIRVRCDRSLGRVGLRSCSC